MTTLAHAVVSLRRMLRAISGLALALIFASLVVAGIFSIELDALKAEHYAVVVAWLSLLLHRIVARQREADRSSRGARLDLEIGLFLFVGAHALLQTLGGLGSSFYPTIFVLAAFVVAFARRPAGELLIAAAIGLEAAVHFITEAQQSASAWLIHSAFIIVFGSSSALFTRAEIARVRVRSQQELDAERARLKEESRIFRLVAAPTDRKHPDEDRVHQSSVEEVHHQLYHLLLLLKRSLEAHSCVLLMLDEAGTLQIAELVSDADEIAPGPFAAGEGAVGAVAKRGLVMNLEHLKPGYGGIAYYAAPSEVRAFLGVPVLERGQVVGVLCVDRLEDRGFSVAEEEIVHGAVQQALRAIENERVFVQLDRSKREQTVLYRASQALGAALDEDAVIEAGLGAAEEIATYDFAAVTLYDAADRRHRIRRAVGERAEELQGLAFKDNASLTAMVVKNRHYLPYRGEFDPRQQTVFTKRANLRGMGSLLILPLVVREDAVGTLALSARRQGAFPPGVRATLQVLANQLAVSLSNAAAVRRLEQMATTDGLTGCLNKRTFLDELDRRLRSAERFNRKLSLIVTDIDHFKNVNDTYGHATGDVVIKELGAVLQRCKRETDIVARFGGEEFCVLCEETDSEGAILLAERIREELGATVFQTELGKLQVTASLGVATFPTHAKTSGDLFEITDKALYAAKHNGRDQVRTAA